jgi:hypothetical protein
VTGEILATDVVYLGAANLAGYLAGALLARNVAARFGAVASLRAMMVLATLAFFASSTPLVPLLLRQGLAESWVGHTHRATQQGAPTPEQTVAGLTDFGPGRSKLFPNSGDAYFKVHHREHAQADVTEGSGGVWERLHYDWTDPSRVVLTTTDSNLWGGASGHTYTFTRQSDGTTHLDVFVVLEGKNLRGRLLGLALGTIGKGVPEKAFEYSVKAVETRNSSVARAVQQVGRR